MVSLGGLRRNSSQVSATRNIVLILIHWLSLPCRGDQSRPYPHAFFCWLLESFGQTSSPLLNVLLSIRKLLCARLIPSFSLASPLSFCSLFIFIYSVTYPLIFLALVFLSHPKSFPEASRFPRNGLKIITWVNHSGWESSDFELIPHLH